MAGYRLFFLDDEGHINRAAEFECDGDAEAMLHAEDQWDEAPMELWSGPRMLHRFPRRQEA
jgi:hypothetical protein